MERNEDHCTGDVQGMDGGESIDILARFEDIEAEIESTLQSAMFAEKDKEEELEVEGVKEELEGEELEVELEGDELEGEELEGEEDELEGEELEVEEDELEGEELEVEEDELEGEEVEGEGNGVRCSSTAFSIHPKLEVCGKERRDEKAVEEMGERLGYEAEPEERPPPLRTRYVYVYDHDASAVYTWAQRRTVSRKYRCAITTQLQYSTRCTCTCIEL